VSPRNAIDIKDNVFVGYGAIILPGVTIGSNSIIGAGAVVTKDVPEGQIVAGVPAVRIGYTEDLVVKLEQQTKELPWAKLIEEREGSYDVSLESELKKLRVKYFFGS
jgi:serine acetyltransferase